MSDKPAYIVRMIDELNQLNAKIKSLCDFLHTEKYEQLSFTQKSLLCDQLSAMRKYSEVLDARIVLEERLHEQS
jgi:hypothetical protein